MRGEFMRAAKILAGRGNFQTLFETFVRPPHESSFPTDAADAPAASGEGEGEGDGGVVGGGEGGVGGGNVASV